jgi:hypothetical protein
MTSLLRTNITFSYANLDIFLHRQPDRSYLKAYIVNLLISDDDRKKIGIEVKHDQFAYLIFDDARNESVIFPISNDDLKNFDAYLSRRNMKYEIVESDVVTFLNKVEASTFDKALGGKYEYTTVNGNSNFKVKNPFIAL